MSMREDEGRLIELEQDLQQIAQTEPAVYQALRIRAAGVWDRERTAMELVVALGRQLQAIHAAHQRLLERTAPEPLVVHRDVAEAAGINL